MKILHTLLVVAGFLFALNAGAGNTMASEATKKIDPLPRDLEIQLALSALPPHLRDKATVYTLDPDRGFEVARKGMNGFHAYVARTDNDTAREAGHLRNTGTHHSVPRPGGK